VGDRTKKFTGDANEKLHHPVTIRPDPGERRV
jgi:hypothetical protein